MKVGCVFTFAHLCCHSSYYHPVRCGWDLQRVRRYQGHEGSGNDNVMLRSPCLWALRYVTANSALTILTSAQGVRYSFRTLVTRICKHTFPP